MLFSPTVTTHRACVKAGTDAQLIVFDGLPHTSWTDRPVAEITGSVCADVKLLR